MLILFTALLATASPQTPPPADHGTTQSATTTPSAVVAEKDTLELGAVPVGKIQNAFFTLTNKGSKPVAIKSVSSSCGCTVVSPTKPHLEPGESTHVTFTFNPHGLFGPTTRTITVQPDDGGPLLLTIHSDVDAPYFTMPHILVIPAKEGEEKPASETFRFAPTRRSLPIKSVSIEPADAPLTLKWKNSSVGEVTGDVTFTPSLVTAQLLNNFKMGNALNAEIVLQTTSGEQASINVIIQFSPKAP